MSSKRAKSSSSSTPSRRCTGCANPNCKATATIEQRLELAHGLWIDWLSQDYVEKIFQDDHVYELLSGVPGNVFCDGVAIDDQMRIQSILDAVCPPALLRELFVAVAKANVNGDVAVALLVKAHMERQRRE